MGERGNYKVTTNRRLKLKISLARRHKTVPELVKTALGPYKVE